MWHGRDDSVEFPKAGNGSHVAFHGGNPVLCFIEDDVLLCVFVRGWVELDAGYFACVAVFGKYERVGSDAGARDEDALSFFYLFGDA